MVRGRPRITSNGVRGIPRRKKTRCESRLGRVDSLCQIVQEVLILLLRAFADYVGASGAGGPVRVRPQGLTRGSCVGAVRVPVPRQQRAQFVAFGPPGDYPLQDVGKIGKWFDVVELAGLDQGIGDRPMTGSRFSADTDITIHWLDAPQMGHACAHDADSQTAGLREAAIRFQERNYSLSGPKALLATISGG